MIPYIQNRGQGTTLEHWKLILNGNNEDSFAAFAYVTDSGVAKLKMQLKNEFEKSRKCRWLFGIDYGRTHPTALKKMKDFGSNEIRIFDGDFVLESKLFKPRFSYHMKTAFTFNKDGSPHRQIVGSGNLSASGLLSAVEAGCLVDYSTLDRDLGKRIVKSIEAMWDYSTPLNKILKDYEKQYSIIIKPENFGSKPSDVKNSKLFWIDIGYVTKNRGADKPGNQFDLPRDSHVHLGLKKVRAPKKNSILGDLDIVTPDGRSVTRTLRFGNNDMEKLTLPIPEDYGYDSYDGKILTFTVIRNKLVLEAFEPDDFYRIYARRISSVREMRGGRKYGTIS
jgi:HKD family nuclease